MQHEDGDRSGREQNTSLLLDAPIELVWEVWTKSEHIQHWWGPDGFSNTIQEMKAESGGEWIFTMHGPNGQSYPNKTIFREVVWHEKIVHEHFDPNFIAIIQFEPQGDKTLLSWHKFYETRALFEMVEHHYKASEGLKQTLAKLEKYLLKNSNRQGKYEQI